MRTFHENGRKTEGRGLRILTWDRAINHRRTVVVEGAVCVLHRSLRKFLLCLVMEHLSGLTGYQPKSGDGKFLVPEILSLFQSFQYKFETMFDGTSHSTSYRLERTK